MFVNILINLLLINFIVVLAHESGFFVSLDEWVSKKWKFHHLPKIMMCALCQTWWLSLLYVILTPGALSILSILLCLVNAHLTEITTGIWRTVKTAINDFLGWINTKL